MDFQAEKFEASFSELSIDEEHDEEDQIFPQTQSEISLTPKSIKKIVSLNEAQTV